MLNLKQGTAATVNLKEPLRRPWRQQRQGGPGMAWLGPAVDVNATDKHVPRWGDSGACPRHLAARSQQQAD